MIYELLLKATQKYQSQQLSNQNKQCLTITEAEKMEEFTKEKYIDKD